MIEALRRNIDTEIGMLREISSYSNQSKSANEIEKKQLDAAVESLIASIKLINRAIPEILQEVNYENKLPSTRKTDLEQVTVKRTGSSITVNLQAKDKERFLRELSLNENVIKNIKNKSLEQGEKFEDLKAARGYLKLSNRFFLQTASDLIKKGSFRSLYTEIKKANLDVLFETYVAMMLFTTLLSFFAGIFLTTFLMFFDLGISFPYVGVYTGSILGRLPWIFWIPFVLPVATFGILYIYPSTEKDSLEKRIDQELPFAVIHMSAISGSGIEPSEIFKIIGLSKEYPFLRREIRKVLNQTNIYGYDLVTALSNVSKSTPSQKLSELFNGMATTVSSGGELQEFFEKRAETLLANYRFEREKFNQVAETFMDIYISVVIATPMILMLLLVMIQMTGIETGFSNNMLAGLIIMLVALINIFFLGFLQIKQPTY